MTKTTRIVLYILLAMMLIALPFAVPTGSMLSEYRDEWAEYAWDSESMQIRDTEIYECSWEAASIDSCFDVRFDGCSIHDCDEGNDVIRLSGSTAFWNGEELRLPKGVSLAFDHADVLKKAFALYDLLAR